VANLIWRVKLVAELPAGATREVEVARLERDEQAGLADLGLRLAEAKQLTAALQAEMVSTQVSVVGERCRWGVVRNPPFSGYAGEQKPPAFAAGFRLRRWPVEEAVSLSKSSALRLQSSKAQQCQPMRMALAAHQFARAFALTFRASATHEAVMVQVEL
jgi:hypothetical protein